VKAKETAVILIEFQNEFCKPNGKLYELVKAELLRQNTVANAVRLAAEARVKGCLIVHCPFVFDGQWMDKHSVSGILQKIKEAGSFRRGTWGAQLIEELRPLRGDVLLHGKRALSGFSNTELKDVLKERGIRNVACAGLLSNVCVEATARAAYDRGYQVVVVKDATAAATRLHQDYFERETAPVLGAGLTVEEFLRALE
jgi:ureidoacrylate peracid hydrolase